LYGPLFSRASEIALTGNFPYWLDTVLGGFSLYQTPHFSATYPFDFFGSINYGKALEVMYTLSYLTCFHNLILYLNLYVLLRVAGAGGPASLFGGTLGGLAPMEHHFSHSRTTVTYGMRIGFVSTHASTFLKNFAAS
jgi:hypothetical protein